MAVKNSYVDTAGVPVVDNSICVFCLRCVQACPTKSLIRGEGLVEVTLDTAYGCIGCLQCSAVCPEGAVSVSGRAIKPGDIVPLPPPDARSTADQLGALLNSRRSIRRFRRTEVEREKLEQILKFAAMAPMGVPPSDVQVEVFSTREQVRQLAKDNLDANAKAMPFMKLFTTWVGRLMFGRTEHQKFRSFIYPLTKKIDAEWRQGYDKLMFDAPAVLYIHGTEWVDPMDVGIVMTYAMLAAESLGLGSCVVGSLHPLMMRKKKLCEKYNVPPSHKHGILLAIGYPTVKYRHAIRRRLGRVNWR